jgi:putative flippase GtrA
MDALNLGSSKRSKSRIENAIFADWKGINLSIVKEMVGYFLISLAAFAADMTCYVALIKLANVHYLYASACGLLLGVWVTYLGSIHWVFSERQLSQKPSQEFASFFGIGIVGWLASMMLIYGLVEWAGIGPVLAKWSAVSFSFCLNFGLRKVYLFSSGRIDFDE